MASRNPQKKGGGHLEKTVHTYLQSPDEVHLNEVVQAARGLVYRFVHLYSPGKPNEDLAQAGFEGLLKALRRYDPEREVSFVTYAGHCIMGEIRHHMRKDASFYRPAWAANLQKRAERLVENSLREFGEIPCRRCLASMLNVTEEGLAEALRAGLVTLDDVALSRVQSVRYEHFRLPIEDRIVLEQAIERLSGLQRKVIALLFYRDMSQREAAAELGINQRKVSRLLHRGLEKMAEFIG